MNNLIRKSNYLGKWDDFRKRRDIAVGNYLTARKRQESTKINLVLCKCLVGLKTFRAYFRQEAVRIRARDRIKFILTICLARYRRNLCKKGLDREARFQNYLRNVFTTSTMCMHDKIVKNCKKKALIPFLIELNNRDEIKVCMRNMMERVLFI